MLVLVFVTLLAAVLISRRGASTPGFLLGAASLLISPSLSEAQYQAVGFLLIGVAFLLAATKRTLRLSPGVVAIMGVFAALHFLPVVVTLVSLGYAPEGELYSAAIAFALAVAVTPILSDRDYSYAAAKLFVTANVLMAASALATLVLNRTLGIGTRYEFGNPLSNYGTPVPLDFPLTTSLGSTQFFIAAFGEIDRWTGLAREPGMAAVYCLISLIIVQSVRNFPFRWTSTIVLALGVLGTGSTSGILIFFVVVILILAYGAVRNYPLYRFLLSLCIVSGLFVFSAAVLSFARGVIEEKEQRDSVSYSDRMADVESGLQALEQSPWLGIGLDGQSFSLIGGIAKWGLGYPILVAVFISLVVRVTWPNRAVAIGGGGLFLVFLTTQPALGSFAAFVMMGAVAGLLQREVEVDGASPLNGRASSSSLAKMLESKGRPNRLPFLLPPVDKALE